MKFHPFTAAALLAIALAATLPLLAPIPPLQDFNEWIYQGWLMGQLFHGAAVPFEVKPWPVPNAAAQVILGVLNLPLGPRAAGIAYIALYLVGFTWLAAALARHTGRFDPATFLLAVLIGAINSPFWDGYANSQLGLLLYMLHVLRQRRPAGTGPLWDLAMGLALFFCHAVMLAVFALHTALRAWQQRHLARAATVLTPPFALLAWYLLRDDNYGEYIPPFGTTLTDFIAYKAYTAAKLGPYQNLIIGSIGDADRAPLLYWSGVAANLTFVLVALVPLTFALLRRLLAGDRSPAMLTAAACLAGFAVLPSAMFGVVNVGERLMLPAMLTALACCPDPLGLRRYGAAIAALAPAVLLYFLLILPAAIPTAAINHLAAHDPNQRMRLLFWHRPFQFQTQIAAAQRGDPVRLGFTTSLLRPVAR